MLKWWVQVPRMQDNGFCLNFLKKFFKDAVMSTSDFRSPSGILTVPRKQKKLKKKTLTDWAWHRKIRSLLTHMSVSAREVDMTRYFHSITFQDAVEKIIDNLSSTSKPQEALSWSCFPHTTWINRNDHRKPVDGETPITRNLRGSFQWFIFHSVANSLTAKLGSIQSNTPGIDCLLFVAYYVTFVL